MNIETDIKRYKKQLINKAKKKGLFENFGLNEVMKLKDNYPYLNVGCSEEYKNSDLIDDFEEWASSFDDNSLKVD